MLPFDSLQLQYHQLNLPEMLEAIKSLEGANIAITSISIAVSTVLLYVLYPSKRPRPHNWVPVVPYTIPYIGNGLELGRDAKGFIDQCKSKYGPVFQILTMKSLSHFIVSKSYSYGRTMVVVTGRYAGECLKMGDDFLSFEEGLLDILPVARIIEVSYSKRKRQTGPEFDYTKNPLIRTIRNNFKTHQLATFQERVKHAVSMSIEQDVVFEPGNDYAVINMPFVQSMMVRISGLIFAGQAVGGNSELLEAMSEYSQSIFNASILYMIFPGVVADFITRHTMSVGRHIGIMMKVLTPVLAQLVEDEEKSGKKQPMDFMHMMLHTPNSRGKIPTAEETAFWLQDAAFASLHTTSLFTILALHNLSDRPDIQKLLRKEMDQTRDKMGEITLDTIKHMPIVDSFVRETLRLGGDFIGMNHKAMRDVILSNGVLIPKGTSVGMALNDAHLDPEVQNAFKRDIPLTEFDALRFIDEPSKKSTSVGPDLLVFGMGHHACPGRYLATHQIGYIVVRMLQEFDITACTANGARAINTLALVSGICAP
ncbi:hypothetical protein INT43_000490 [Umbelopsis isabellina]|uniref:Cytochrome P450 n=1 Tax=Mortierella isabellina TaxID=91625 RepID=A0A8H7UG71_MORIS|nr:hypothetical protein INT43_000490 [Umbelopsis isabellina]